MAKSSTATAGRAKDGCAVIIGGSGGIGEACGHRLAARGYSVVLVARDRSRLAEVALRIGPTAQWRAADCGDADEVSKAFEGLGPVAVLVHAAGIREGAPVADQPVSVLDDLYSSHLRSAFLTVKASLAAMSGGSRIILMSSVAARRPVPGLSGYCAMKAAMGMFARSLSMELEERRIGVYLVAPGQVDTPLLVKRWHCLQPDDVAHAVEFLSTVDSALNIREFDIRSVTRGPHAPPLSGPPDGPIGIALVAK
jgi:NAD(P)-dependent dehydrogenase (short-subunit alcohol dehydrogenase family)